MPVTRRGTKSIALNTLATIGITVAALYFAQEILIPLALAVLLAFLLAPPAAWLERRKLNRVAAVLAVVTAAFAIILSLGWIIGRQVVHLAEQLPTYQDEIIRKAERLRGTGTGVGANFARLGREIERAAAEPSTRKSSTQPTTSPGVAEAAIDHVAEDPTRAYAREITGGPPTSAPSPAGRTPANPLYTVSLPAPVSPIKTLATYLGVVLNPLGTAGLVVVFVIFILMDRENLRDRMLRLVSRGKYTTTTRAIDDAVGRISKYMVAQSLVNGTYGLAIAIGLWLIGLTVGHGTTFPSFLLWGLLCGVLRFIPYIGPWIAASFPVALSLAVYPGFGAFGATLGMFVLIELISNNVMEPWLYGASTGISTMAIIVAAVFWTWLWGPVGLLLSTPLTVCIVVMGKHVAPLKFLDVLLGDQPALPAFVSYYQRLLASDRGGASAVITDYSTRVDMDRVFDDVIVPAVRMARRDRSNGDLSVEDESKFIAATDEIVTKSGAKLPVGPNNSQVHSPRPTVLACPSHHRTEELTLKMLDIVLREANYQVDLVTTRALPAEIEDRVSREKPDVVFISVLPPGGTIQAKYLCRRLRRKAKEVKIVIGYFGRTKSFDKLLVSFRKAGASYVTTSLAQSQAQLRSLSNAAARPVEHLDDGIRTTSAVSDPPTA